MEKLVTVQDFKDNIGKEIIFDFEDEKNIKGKIVQKDGKVLLAFNSKECSGWVLAREFYAWGNIAEYSRGWGVIDSADLADIENARLLTSNSMPTLEPGMVVRLCSERFGDFGLYLYINDNWTLSLNGRDHQPLEDVIEITEVHKSTVKSMSLGSLKDFLELVWSKKDSEKLTAKAELQAKLDKLQADHESAIASIKSELDELEV